MRVLAPERILTVLLTACAAAPSAPPKETMASTHSAQSLEAEIAFLRDHGELVVLESPSGGRVVVSPKYQGRVMTSGVEPNGPSLGFVNHDFISGGKTSTAFDNYGGEDRFWLGPEGGQYGLYFPPGKPFHFSNWQTPHELQEGAWAVRDRDATKVTIAKDMKVTNWKGTSFDVGVTRRIAMVDSEKLAALLHSPLPAAVKWVGFESSNRIKNRSAAPWAKEGGLPSVWILGMYNPSPDMRVVIPFDRNGRGEVVNDRYFGKVPADRLSVKEDAGYLVFKCDGQHRSKIGLSPHRARNVLGSYSASAKLLTLVVFDKPEGASDYVNSMWEMQNDPYAGDAVNSYNDGPTEPGKPSLGGFYELETSSPGAALAPGEEMTHTQTTLHFVGEPTALEAIAKATLGVSLSALP
jgi:hypothetical protein